MEIEFTTVGDTAESPEEEADPGLGTPRAVGRPNGGILNTISGIVHQQVTLDDPLAHDLVLVSREHILQLLGPATFRRIFQDHSRSGGGQEGDGENAGLEDDGDYVGLTRRRRRRARAFPKPACPLQPSAEGKKLMETGVFGSNDQRKTSTRQKKPLMATRLMGRELGQEVESKKANQLITQVRVPSAIYTRCHY